MHKMFRSFIKFAIGNIGDKRRGISTQRMINEPERYGQTNRCEGLANGSSDDHRWKEAVGTTSKLSWYVPSSPGSYSLSSDAEQNNPASQKPSSGYHSMTVVQPFC